MDMSKEECPICYQEFTDEQWQRKCVDENMDKNAVKCAQCNMHIHCSCLTNWRSGSNKTGCPGCRFLHPVLYIDCTTSLIETTVIEAVLSNIKNEIRRLHDQAYIELTGLAFEKEDSADPVYGMCIEVRNRVKKDLQREMQSFQNKMLSLLAKTLHKSIYPPIPWETRDSNPRWQRLMRNKLITNMDSVFQPDKVMDHFYKKMQDLRAARIHRHFTRDEEHYNRALKEFVLGSAKANALLNKHDPRNFKFAEEHPHIIQTVVSRFHDDMWSPWVVEQVRQVAPFDLDDLALARYMKLRMIPRDAVMEEIKALYDQTARSVLQEEEIMADHFKKRCRLGDS